MGKMDNNFWKWMERGQGAVGALATLATLYYTAGVYYGWNQPSSERKDYVPAGHSMMPPWWIIALGVLAVLMLLTSWGMIAMRLREEKKRGVPTTKQTATLSLSLEDQQFRLRIRTFILSKIDELGQWFGRTIVLSIADYRDREKDEFLGDLFEKSLQNSFYKNQRDIKELFANNNQPDVESESEP